MPAGVLRVRSARGWVGGGLSALRNPLYSSGYALVANTAGTTAIGTAFWAVAAHLYGRQALGRSSALIAALILVSSLAQLNLANTLPRFLPLTGRRAGRLIAYSYAMSSAVALVAGLAFVIALPRLNSRWEFLGGSLSLTAAFVAAAVIWGMFSLQDAALLSLRRASLVPAENAVYGVAKLALLVGLAALFPSIGIFLSWVIPLVIIVPVINWFIFRRYLSRRDSATDVATVRAREVIRFTSVDYVGSMLGQASGNLLPLVVLSTLGAAANGTFYIAWTIANGLDMVAANFATSLLAEGSAAPHRLRELTRGVLARCLAVTAAGAALVALAAHPILSIYGHGYAVHGSLLLGLLVAATIPRSLLGVTFSLDRIAGKVGRATLTRLALAVLVLGGSWYLLGREGVDGVGVAWVGANLLLAGVRLPTIVRAARRRRSPRATLARAKLANSGTGVRAPQRGGLHRRPASGRHRAGTHRAGGAAEPGPRPVPPEPALGPAAERLPAASRVLADAAHDNGHVPWWHPGA